MTKTNRIGRQFTVDLKRWGDSGETIAHVDSEELHVLGGIPGEEAIVEIVRDRKGRVAAQVVQALSESPDRRVPPCPYFGPCTGCQWQHVEYRRQLEIKRETVIEALAEAGLPEAPVAPTLASPEEYGYRNHARFTVGRRWGELGFVNRESRRFVPVESCMLMQPWINQTLAHLQRKAAETSQLSIRYGMESGDYLIQPRLKNPDIEVESGQQHYTETIEGRSFQVAASSFFQVNPKQAEALARLVRTGLLLTGRETVVDAYAGVAAFAVLVADQCRRVIAIEESASAIQDAERNVSGMDKIELVQAKTEDVLSSLSDPPDGVVLDPPRAGCHPRVLEALIGLRPRRVVYVSCEPATLSRDLAVLCRETFQLESVQPVDMFPQTHHVECVAVLVLRDSPRGSDSETVDLPPVLASTSPRRRELMKRMGAAFDSASPSVNEDALPGESPRRMVERLALAKAWSVYGDSGARVIIGADSVVALDGRVLGKPGTLDEARSMLTALRGREHDVYTGVAVVGSTGEAVSSRRSRVVMREYSDEELETYVLSGEPMDKAGGYAIQDQGFHPASLVEGCYNNVMGLPTCLLADMLVKAGMSANTVERPPECAHCPAE